jgi:hypothetical protein
MKRKFNCDRERKNVERELGKLGIKLSKPFIARAKELIVELSKFKGVKINHLIMGMGGWVLNGTLPYKEFWGADLSKVEEGIHEFSFHDFDRRSMWIEYYENVNPGICKVVHELNDILETLTNEQYLDIFDIDAVEMKELLTN